MSLFILPSGSNVVILLFRVRVGLPYALLALVSVRVALENARLPQAHKAVVYEVLDDKPLVVIPAHIRGLILDVVVVVRHAMPGMHVEAVERDAAAPVQGHHDPVQPARR